MKRIATLVSVLALGAMTVVNAETRTWDFTKWSDETIANLKAGSDWSDIEKASDSEPTEMSKDNCFWQINATANVNADGYLMANGVVIKELEGLKYTNTADRSFAIAVNYPDVPNAGFGPYEGGRYIWLGSKQKDYFLIPAVTPGATIKMGVESHKKSEARGVNLYVGAGHEGTQLKAPDGSEVAVPTTYQDLEWVMPSEVSTASDVQIYNTNGCHIYYITVTDNSTAIDDIAVESAPVEYFNLQGQRIDNPSQGLFIRKQGQNATKVFVK